MKLWENPTLTLLLGGLTTGFTSVLSFYFGASHTPATTEKKGVSKTKGLISVWASLGFSGLCL